jgi:hypothetical protein
MMGLGTTASPSQVRMFLEATSPQELVRLQLFTNTMLMGRADFTDIQHVDGKWYAWFLVDISKHPEVLKKLNEPTSSKRRPRTE